MVSWQPAEKHRVQRQSGATVSNSVAVRLFDERLPDGYGKSNYLPLHLLYTLYSIFLILRISMLFKLTECIYARFLCIAL